jgi:ribosomal protein S18 acetylase RimI-like enzyme
MLGMDRGTARPAAGAVLIRRAGPDDAPAIVAVLAEVAAEGRWRAQGRARGVAGHGRAIALYVAHGFEVGGVRRDHYRRRDGTLRSAILMGRRVPGPPPAG